MTPLILNLLQISILMSIVAVVLHLILDVFSNSIPPKWKYYIWGIVLVSLLIPFRPRFADPIVTVDAPRAVTDSISGTDDATGGSGAPAAEPTFWSQIDIPTLLLCIWIAGMVVFLAVVFIRHIHFMRTAKRWGKKVDDDITMALVEDNKAEMNIKTDIEVIRSKMISVPMMAGIIKPVLFLPVYDLDEEELTYVIRHELVHYRKFDILLKFLSILANAVHWFNPLVYVMQRWIHTDCEVACDYEVTKSYEHDERVKYVESLIGVAKHEIRYKTVFSTNFYDGKKTMKKRLESVLSDNKTRTAIVVVVVAVLVVTCIIAGSAMAVSSGDEEIVPYIGEAKAKEIALQKTGGGDLVSFSYDDKGGSRVYQINITDGKYDYKISMDAKSGDISSYEKLDIPDKAKAGDDKTASGNGNTDSTDSNSSSGSGSSSGSSSGNSSSNSGSSGNSSSSTSLIGASKAKSIALSRVGGGKVTQCELDSDDGVKVYDIKINYNGYEYEVEVNAKTGSIKSFDKEKIEHDDDHDDD